MDLHWQMGVGDSAAVLSGEELLARAERLTLLGREVLTPSATDMILLTCLHGARHRWDSIELLLGLAVQVGELPQEDWPGVADAARRAGCLRRVTVAVTHACRIFGLEVPREIAALLETDRLSRAFVASLTPESLANGGQRSRQQHVARVLWTVGMEDASRDNGAHTLARLVRPGVDDWASIQLPTRLEWLYYLLRPLRLCAKMARMTPMRRGEAIAAQPIRSDAEAHRSSRDFPGRATRDA